MNEPNRLENDFKKLSAITLSESARARIKGNLDGYVKFYGVTEGVRGAKSLRSSERVPRRTSFSNLLFFRTSHMIPGLLIALLLSGSVSLAAENSAPGDALYFVKTEVNEPLKSALAFSSEAEAKLQIELAEERLTEANRLAEQNTLSAETKAALESRLESHTRAAIEEITALNVSGRAEIGLRLQSELEALLKAYQLAETEAAVDSDTTVEVDTTTTVSEPVLNLDTAIKATTSLDTSILPLKVEVRNGQIKIETRSSEDDDAPTETTTTNEPTKTPENTNDGSSEADSENNTDGRIEVESDIEIDLDSNTIRVNGSSGANTGGINMGW